MSDFENFKLVNKGVKILIGMPEIIEKRAAEFEKTHRVINIIQKCETQMFIFYLIEDDSDNETEGDN
jgi:hypothetical protein